MSENLTYRGCWHGILLYPEDKSHVDALSKLSTAFETIAVLHDKDKEKDGSLKKPHWHVVVNTRNQTWNTSIAKQVGIKLNYIQKLRNPEAAIEYLIHWNEESKYQYPIEDCFGATRLKNLLKKITVEEQIPECEKVLELIEWITNADRPITISSFARVCASTDRWDIFRRSASIYMRIIDEHNSRFRDKDDAPV